MLPRLRPPILPFLLCDRIPSETTTKQSTLQAIRVRVWIQLLQHKDVVVAARLRKGESLENLVKLVPCSRRRLQSIPIFVCVCGRCLSAAVKTGSPVPPRPVHPVTARSSKWCSCRARGRLVQGGPRLWRSLFPAAHPNPAQESRGAERVRPRTYVNSI